MTPPNGMPLLSDTPGHQPVLGPCPPSGQGSSEAPRIGYGSVQPWERTVYSVPDQNGRTIVITGATSGIGRHTSLSLSAAGARVVVVARNPDKARALISEAASMGGG